MPIRKRVTTEDKKKTETLELEMRLGGDRRDEQQETESEKGGKEKRASVIGLHRACSGETGEAGKLAQGSSPKQIFTEWMNGGLCPQHPRRCGPDPGTAIHR